METILQRLTDLDEVQNALLVGKDGLIVAGTMHSEDDEMVGAMSAAAFGSITSYTAKIHHGDAQHVVIETSKGTIQVEEAGDLILIVTMRNGGNTGRVRLEMKKVCRQVAQMVASY
ncbi:MAG TPA: roadblock/LC7 domain-containing protein [Ktedonosporobacter sp.]|nr:roadblock/LC7 domain-containing protein [Ktedonosporobacter sp.]